MRASGGTFRAVGPPLAALLLVSFALRAATGTAVLDHTYHFDERYSFRNVSALLVEGSTRPSNAFYPSVSYLPQTAVLAASEGLHRVTGLEALSIFDETAPDGWSATAYLLVRLMAAIFGTFGVWLTFVLGRRMFDARVGLLAAVLLSAVPSHVSHSALFKPDVLVALLVTLTFLWSRDAVHARRPRRYLLSGCGVGLAVAAKYTGIAGALPLVAGSVVAGWRDRRLWLWLAAAGGVAVAVFAVLNPHLSTVLAYLPRLWRIYGEKGAVDGGGHLGVVAEEVSFLLRNHRLPVFVFVLAGVGWAGIRALGQGTELRRRLDAVMLLAVPVGYSAVYAASTTLFKGQNYLAVTPFTSLLAAWPMVALWDRARGRVPSLGRPWASAGIWGLVAVAVLVKPVQEVYRVLVPTSFERAGRLLAGLDHGHPRFVYYEREGYLVKVPGDQRGLVVFPVERLGQVPDEKLWKADAEIFFARRLEGPEAPSYWRRLAEHAGRSRRIEPRFLEVRGPPVVVFTHPWVLAAEPLDLALEPVPGRNRFRAELPPVPSGEWVSFGIRMPRNRLGGRVTTLRVEGQELPLYSTGPLRGPLHVVTPREEAAWKGGVTTIAFEEGLRLRWVPKVTFYRWRAPEAIPGASGG